ncbi:hypothetical protein SDC9_208818 [bioreactor metagenome]|uniref:Uncharacterized protein n=1 Tax=bioreactor metagenome TaxID=1076179 RepID=A0A645JL88_9ZZZZ
MHVEGGKDRSYNIAVKVPQPAPVAPSRSAAPAPAPAPQLTQPQPQPQPTTIFAEEEDSPEEDPYEVIMRMFGRGKK